jgi:predicted transcriptional regulator
MNKALTSLQQRVYVAIKNHPNSTCFQLGKVAGLDTRTVRNTLCGLESHGILLSQDNYDRVTIFREVNIASH